ncbi:MAG: family 20 glycosylhydrolase [Verrucomicrobiota bacterium]
MNQELLFHWNPAATSPAINALLECLAEEFPLNGVPGGRKLVFSPVKDPGVLKVSTANGKTEIAYGSLAAAGRGIGHTLAGQSVDARTTFRTMGIMLDCSRQAVMTVPYLKRWMRRLALMGYNLLMLYTEDTYQIPGEPYFGYMRGGYSGDEIEEIDAYSKRLGIEVVACIQTLGHLDQILKWPRFHEVMDTTQVLLIGEEKTYELISKMIGFWSEHLTSRRIHVGMDEAFDMTRGRYLDKNGWQPPFDVFNSHLARIESLCVAHGVRPMIWSDMYFKMGSPKHEYYDRDSVIPAEVKAKVPKNVDLVYWDYYSTDENFYTEWIKRHRDLSREPIMASGIWTWARFWYDHAKTVAAVDPCVNACRKEGLKEILFTLWGDSVSYCEFDSAFAGIAYAADRCYGGPGDADDLARLLSAVDGGDYSTMLLGTGLEVVVDPEIPPLSASTVMWDDPLLGIGWQGYLYAGKDFWPKYLEKLRALREAVAPHKLSQGPPDYGYLWALSDVMIRKIEFREKLVAAYGARDLERLRQLKDGDIPEILASLAELESAFRRQWLRRNKPPGMEATQIRLGAGSTRFRETAMRLAELCDGRITAIEELDIQPDGLDRNPVSYFVWLATGSVRI